MLLESSKSEEAKIMESSDKLVEIISEVNQLGRRARQWAITGFLFLLGAIGVSVYAAFLPGDAFSWDVVSPSWLALYAGFIFCMFPAYYLKGKAHKLMRKHRKAVEEHIKAQLSGMLEGMGFQILDEPPETPTVG